MRAFTFVLVAAFVVLLRLCRDDLTFAEAVNLFAAVAIVLIVACVVILACY